MKVTRNAMEIGKAIAVRRAELGLTQADLAARAEISRRTLVAVEAGQADLGLQRLIRLMQALGLALSMVPERSRPTESDLRSLFIEGDDE